MLLKHQYWEATSDIYIFFNIYMFGDFGNDT